MCEDQLPYLRLRVSRPRGFEPWTFPSRPFGQHAIVHVGRREDGLPWLAVRLPANYSIGRCRAQPLSYALRGCSHALLAGSNPAPASGSQVAAGGDRWSLMAVRGHLGDTPRGPLVVPVGQRITSRSALRWATCRTAPQCRRCNYPVSARAVQGMARARSGQAPAWPLSSDRSVCRGSRIKRDFACAFTRHFPPVLVVLRSQSRLGWRGGHVHSAGQPRT